jgi:HAD superfamily 5'-nucleotidase-like hydrolase
MLAARALTALRSRATRALKTAISPRGVFVSHDIDLRGIKWVGFCLESNLAILSPTALATMYSAAAAHLVREQHYPEALLNLRYDGFAVRGLSLDTRRGVLMKLNFLNGVASGTAHLGRRCLSDQEVVHMYGSMHVSNAEMRSHFRQLVDPLTLVDASLMSDIVQTLVESGRSFHPTYVYHDIMMAMASLGVGELLLDMQHRPQLYYNDKPQLRELLLALRDAGRKTFLLTNSDWLKADSAMRHILRDQMEAPASWPSLFDCVVVACNRPAWFNVDAPFRSLNTVTNKLRWLPVSELRPGHVYVGGSVHEFMRLLHDDTNNWRDVLYLSSMALTLQRRGCAYEDLSAPGAIGWRIGALVPEVVSEVAAQSTPAYRSALSQLLEAERSIQLDYGEMSAEVLKALMPLKAMLHPHFGSSFRSLTGPTLFAHNLLHHCDIYTGAVENLLEVLGQEHKLHPLRRSMPHEPAVGSL